MKKCGNCGCEIKYDSARFCPECGTKLEELKVYDENEFYSKSRIVNNEFRTYVGDDDEVIVPGSVKVLKFESFVNNHKSITLSSGVEVIEVKAIRSNTLKKIYISDTVKKIEPNAFGILYDNSCSSYFGCCELEEIVVDENNPYYKSIDGNLYSKDGKVLIRVAPGKKEDVIYIPEGVEEVAGSASLYFTTSKKVVLPSTFGSQDQFLLLLPYFDTEKNLSIELEINKYNPNYKVVDQVVYSKDGKTLSMYNPSKKDNSFIIPNIVKLIDDCAFHGASLLEYVIIPNGVEEIGEAAFEGCESLTSVVIPNSVKTIGSAAFCDCYKLDNISLPNGFKTIPSHVFSGCGITNLIIPSTIEKIDDYAFENCGYLTEVVIPSNVKTIGIGAFSECYELELVTLNEGLEVIDKYAFASSNIKNIRIPRSVNKIGVEAFDGCPQLEKIMVPKGKKFENFPKDVSVKEY